MEQQKTVWRKNLDPRYISGEDLYNCVNGLRREMVVCIEKQVDAPTFDQKEQKEVTKTALYLKDLETGKSIYKPCILNVTRGKLLTQISGSVYLEDWYDKPFVMYCKPDKRHGQVVAFRKHYQKAEIKPDQALEKLLKADSIESLSSVWNSLAEEEKKLPVVLAKKNELKEFFT